MKRRDLKPGMEVRNKVTGSIGEVRGGRDGKLLRSHEDFVQVWRFVTRGKEKGDRRPGNWLIKNLEFTA